LRRVFCDAGTTLDHVFLGDERQGFALLADIHWGDANITTIQWWRPKGHFPFTRAAGITLGDEWLARQRRDSDGKRKDKSQRLQEYEAAVRANRQLTALLRSQGLANRADRFAYRGQFLLRQVVRRQGLFGAYLGYLFLDGLAGYGYRPLRSFVAYLLVIAVFTMTYYGLGAAVGPALGWQEALVVSMTAFHGRGFFPAQFQPADPQALVAAVEAFFGLVIEVTFIATLTQRFFAR
jgi:hypothetical protein